MDKLKAVAEIVDSLGTFIVAAIVAYIAYRQYKTDRYKVKLDLYDRRYKVFDAARQFIAHVIEGDNVKREKIVEFTSATVESVFLFGEDVRKYLDTLLAKGARVQRLQTELDSSRLPVGEEHSKKTEEIQECLNWLTQQLHELKTKFRPYLGFQKLK
jgi:vacuolar-type H+-ATPase subunit I/STV1